MRVSVKGGGGPHLGGPHDKDYGLCGFALRPQRRDRRNLLWYQSELISVRNWYKRGSALAANCVDLARSKRRPEGRSTEYQGVI